MSGRGRSADGRILLTGALELPECGKPRRIRLKAVGSHASEALHGFIGGSVAPGARAVTDGWPGCSGLPGSPRDEKAAGNRPAHEILTWVRRAFPDPGRRAMGVRRGLRRKRVQRHPDGFVFRRNRRRHRRVPFGGLPGTGPGLPPATCRDIVGGCA